MDFFGRQYSLTIGDNTYTSYQNAPSLDIKFNVELTASSIISKGTVAILGLSLKTMNPILELAALSTEEAYAKKVRCKLEAGYYTSGMATVIDGYVETASISTPPEMWLTMRVSEEPINIGPAKQLSLPYVENGMKANDIVRAWCKKFNLDYKDLTKDNIGEKHKLQKIYFDQTDLLTGLEKLQLLCDWKLYRRGLTVYAIDRLSADTKTSVIDIDNNSGLLSVSGITFNGCTVTRFLYDPDNTLHKIKLKSELNPQANGTYMTDAKYYVGHFSGNEWYVKYHAMSKVK